MPRLVVKSRANTSLLRRAQRPGFSDNFDRPTGTSLGVTSGEGRAWQYGSNGTAPLWRTNSSGAAVLISGADRNSAYLDAMTTNGKLKVTLTSLGSYRKGGLIGRYRDINNYLFTQQPTAGEGLALYKRVDGTPTRLGDTTYVPQNGDVEEWEFFEENLIVKINGTTRITATDATFLGESNFGLFGSDTALQMAYDDISLTPTIL